MALPKEPGTREMAKFTEDVDGRVTIQTTNNAEVQYDWEYIPTATETNVKETSGFLKGIVINTPLAAGVISVYNNGSGASVPMAVITNPATLLSDTSVRVDYDLAFSSGLTVVTAEAQDITIIYK